MLARHDTNLMGSRAHAFEGKLDDELRSAGHGLPAQRAAVDRRLYFERPSESARATLPTSARLVCCASICTVWISAGPAQPSACNDSKPRHASVCGCSVRRRIPGSARLRLTIFHSSGLRRGMTTTSQMRSGASIDPTVA